MGLGFSAYKWQSDLGAVGGDFSLQSKGGPIQLRDFRGKVVVLYFGYRYCPDVCPTTLSSLASMKKQLTKQEQNSLKVVFISVDPDRDTPKILDDYVKFFDKGFIGVTGSKTEIVNVAKNFGIAYKIHPPKDSKDPENYLVDHTSYALIIGKDGLIRDAIEHNEPINLGTMKIRKYIQEKI